MDHLQVTLPMPAIFTMDGEELASVPFEWQLQIALDLRAESGHTSLGSRYLCCDVVADGQSASVRWTFCVTWVCGVGPTTRQRRVSSWAACNAAFNRQLSAPERPLGEEAGSAPSL